MINIQYLIDKLTFEDVEWLAKRNIHTYLEDNVYNPEFVEYVIDRVDNEEK